MKWDHGCVFQAVQVEVYNIPVKGRFEEVQETYKITLKCIISGNSNPKNTVWEMWPSGTEKQIWIKAQDVLFINFVTSYKQVSYLQISIASLSIKECFNKVQSLFPWLWKCIWANSLSNRCFSAPHQNKKLLRDFQAECWKGEIILVTFALP